MAFNRFHELTVSLLPPRPTSLQAHVVRRLRPAATALTLPTSTPGNIADQRLLLPGVEVEAHHLKAANIPFPTLLISFQQATRHPPDSLGRSRSRFYSGPAYALSGTLARALLRPDHLANIVSTSVGNSFSKSAPKGPPKKPPTLVKATKVTSASGR